MQNNVVQLHKFQETYEIRTIIKDGEPWFIATDLVKALGLNNTTMALRPLDDDEKSTIKRIECGLNPGLDMLTVNESGLYALIVRSTKPQAKKFRKWVTSEVLTILGWTYSHVA